MKEGNIHFFLNFEKLVKREKALLFETLVIAPATDFMPGHVHSIILPQWGWKGLGDGYYYSITDEENKGSQLTHPESNS